jgi:hypothetical protein
MNSSQMAQPRCLLVLVFLPPYLPALPASPSCPKPWPLTAKVRSMLSGGSHQNLCEFLPTVAAV